MPKFPSIPTPTRGNANSTHETIMALKDAVEMLMGTRGDRPANRVFVTESIPVAMAIGDLWVQPSTGRFSYWDGLAWRLTP